MLLSNLNLLATAPGGVARLRELILTLTVQGKLVAQDPKDEPASELLKKIRAEKDRLIAEGKTKRDKPLVEIADEEKPFGLPKGWEWVRLGDVTNYGSPPKASAIQPQTWVLDMEDIEKSSGRLLQKLRFAERPALSDKNCFSKGDVLYGKLRPYLNKVLVADEDGVCTTEIIPFRCYGDYVPQYFRLALSSPLFLDYVNVRSYGMKMPRLGTDDARKAVIPLPPLAEQSRIVTRVEELMRLCDALEAKGQLEATRHAQLVSTLLATLTDSGTPAQLPDDLSKNWHRIATHFDLLLDRPEAVDALEQTILQLAVRGLLVPQDPQDEPASVLLKKIRAEKDKLIAEGKIKRDKALSAIAEDERPFALPSGWSWARFPELGEFGRGKSKHRPRNDPALFNPPKYPLIQTGEVSRAKGIVQEVHSYYSAIGLAQSRMWPKGTLCITIAANIAESAVLGFDSCFPDSVVGFVPASAMGNVEYFLLFVETAKADLLAFAPATAQKNINLEILSSLLIPVPPLNELTRIVARVAQLRRLCFELRQRLSASQSTQAHLAEALVQSVG
jgi:type I restriction enzyme, S subunit